MGLIYINRMQIERTGAEAADVARIGAHREWLAFEDLLIDCLRELGHELVLQTYHPDIPEDREGAEFAIYAHVTRRDLEGDLFYKQMHLRELFTIDRLGWGADHSASGRMPDLSHIDSVAARDFCLELRESFIATGRSKHPQPPVASGTRYPEGYVFVPVQRPNDYVSVHHSGIGVPDFIRMISAWGNSVGRNIVFKLHPDNRFDPEVIAVARECASQYERVHLMDGNIHDLVANAAGIFTINSGVGFESLIHGRPVATFGNCDYRWATFNATPGTIDAALKYLLDFSDADRDHQWRFIYHYWHHHGYSIAPGYLDQSRGRLLKYLEEATAALHGHEVS
ncbi:MAG: hypothetical protein JWQ98_3393 [Chlorobi bacterium]|nr:hypothetical protein [Chlorobiota bacterium]